MRFPEDFPIAKRWKPEYPELLQLYSVPTPNGQKVSIMLEETGLSYEGHRLTLSDADVKSEAFLSLNPNNKIPAIIDPDGPDGAIGLFESGAILQYLAEKTGRFGGEGAARHEVNQWLMWQMGGLGPMMGQMGHFVKFAADKTSDDYARSRYVGEAKRLLGVLDGHLDGREWVAGDYSIADMAIGPWLGVLDFYGAKDVVGWSELTQVPAYLDRFMARPAVQRGKVKPEEG